MSTNPRKAHKIGDTIALEKTKLTMQYENLPTKHNHPVLELRQVIDAVMSSIQESETGGGYMNTKEALPIFQKAI